MYQSGQILFNKYRIEKLIGKGAFGEVYLVTHTGLGSFHAIKVLTKNMRDVESNVLSDYRERFFQEAKIGSRIRHSNIIRVYDVEDQNGVLALVMDYASGGNLAEKVANYSADKRPLPIHLVTSIGKDIAQGLSELHRLDIIHRDLKPSNILFDDHGKALIADLGIAQTSDGITSRTIAGDSVPKHLGTPAYMSPEQERNLGYLQPPSDVYSLGLILFELLAGRNYKSCPPGTRISKIRKDVPRSLVGQLA